MDKIYKDKIAIGEINLQRALGAASANQDHLQQQYLELKSKLEFMTSSYAKRIEKEQFVFKVAEDQHQEKMKNAEEKYQRLEKEVVGTMKELNVETKKKIAFAEGKINQKLEKATESRDQLQEEVLELKRKLETETLSFEQKLENEKKIAKMANEEYKEKLLMSEENCKQLEEVIAKIKKEADAEKEKIAAVEEKSRKMIEEANSSRCVLEQENVNLQAKIKNMSSYCEKVVETSKSMVKKAEFENKEKIIAAEVEYRKSAESVIGKCAKEMKTKIENANRIAEDAKEEYNIAKLDLMNNMKNVDIDIEKFKRDNQSIVKEIKEEVQEDFIKQYADNKARVKRHLKERDDIQKDLEAKILGLTDELTESKEFIKVLLKTKEENAQKNQTSDVQMKERNEVKKDLELKILGLTDELTKSKEFIKLLLQTKAENIQKHPTNAVSITKEIAAFVQEKEKETVDLKEAVDLAVDQTTEKMRNFVQNILQNDKIVETIQSSKTQQLNLSKIRKDIERTLSKEDLEAIVDSLAEGLVEPKGDKKDQNQVYKRREENSRKKQEKIIDRLLSEKKQTNIGINEAEMKGAENRCRHGKGKDITMRGERGGTNNVTGVIRENHFTKEKVEDALTKKRMKVRKRENLLLRIQALKNARKIDVVNQMQKAKERNEIS